jgi:hypothetical protein
MSGRCYTYDMESRCGCPTRHGICIAVFNTIWFTSEWSSAATETLSHLSFWLNSVVLNTRRGSKMAPVMLVGTHKDVVSTPADHRRISSLLSDAFPGALSLGRQ